MQSSSKPDKAVKNFVREIKCVQGDTKIWKVLLKWPHPHLSGAYIVSSLIVESLRRKWKAEVL